MSNSAFDLELMTVSGQAAKILPPKKTYQEIRQEFLEQAARNWMAARKRSLPGEQDVTEFVRWWIFKMTEPTLRGATGISSLCEMRSNMVAFLALEHGDRQYVIDAMREEIYFRGDSMRMFRMIREQIRFMRASRTAVNDSMNQDKEIQERYKV